MTTAADRAIEVRGCDVVVVGCGIAGLSAALHADGRSVAVLCKSSFGRGGSSVHAQGGVAVAVGEDDSPERHAADTVAVGCGLSDTAIARLITNEGPGRLLEILRHGVRLDRDASGRIALGQEAAHSRRRVVHAEGDATGAELVRALAAGVWQSPRIRIDDRLFALDVVVEDGRLLGLVTIDPAGEPVLYLTPAVVLATGGAGRLYAWTTNPVESTGDGLAMAARAGARLADLEFVQFHPTALADGSDPMALLTEALRGEGATLLDEGGDRFMLDLHPSAELAPRDIVARAIWRHRAAGHQTLLDARGIGERFAQRFPTVLSLCLERGLDPRREAVPVSPAAHYHMGGVMVDEDGRSSVQGLWACGEAAVTGLHGANRLASNSLLEALVLGARVGEALSKPGLGQPRPSDHQRLLEQAVLPPCPPRLDDNPAAAEKARDLRAAMWRDVGLERSGEGLERALAEIEALAGAEPAPFGELANMLTAARLITVGALARTESRGAHCRVDHPETAQHWRRRQVFEGERLLDPDPAKSVEAT